MIEEQFEVVIDKNSIDYMRLIRHLRFTIERVVRGEGVAEPEKITALLKTEYPVCYNLCLEANQSDAANIKKTVYEAEAVYLTLHLQRIQSKNESII